MKHYTSWCLNALLYLAIRVVIVRHNTRQWNAKQSAGLSTLHDMASQLQNCSAAVFAALQSFPLLHNCVLDLPAVNDKVLSN
jgi:molybdopterin-guanine dinucleotide biosynthesis protein A